jgi:Tfp pilus assembly protein PilO
MSFMKTHKKYLVTVGVIWAACFVVFLLAYIFVLGPQKNYKKRIENKLAERKQVYESALRASRKENKIRLNEQIERLQSRLRDFVIDFEDSTNLTFDISQIANEKKVASFSSKVKRSSGLSTIPDYKYIYENHIVISFIGGFYQFATFLNALERHRPVIFVDKFTITRSGQDNSVYQVSLNVAALVKKQQSEGLLSEDDKTTDKRPAQVYGTKI